MKPAEWPVSHQAAWEAALRARQGRFSARGPARGKSEATLEKTSSAYGRWMGFLRHRGWLDEAAAPEDLVIPERADAYFAELRELGNADYTVEGRFAGLKAALRILCPEREFGWLLAPGETPLRWRLEMRRREFAVPHSAELYNLGLELMRQAPDIGEARRRQVQMRDGLMITVLASRAPRRRTMAAMRLGQHVRRDEDGVWSVVLDEADTKARRPQAYRLPASLQSWVTRYVEVERAEMLANAGHDAFWLACDGKPLLAEGFTTRVSLRSAQHYGADKAFGTHRARHALGTTAPAEDPAAPGLATAILDVGAGVHRKHYDRGGSAQAAGRFHEALRRDRSAVA